MSTEELIAHAIFSSLSGLSIAATGFGCDVAIRELFAVLTSSKPANGAGSYMGAAPTPINSALSAALITGVQVALHPRLINRSLLLNTLPATFVGVVLSLNAFSTSVRAALVPLFGACLLGLSLTVSWMELAERRQIAKSARTTGDGGRESTLSWKQTGVFAAASFAAGLLSGWCPPPGPALMAVLLAQGRGESLASTGEWRATAALVTFSACILRMGLMLLENGASVGPMPEISVLLVGGLVGLGLGTLYLYCAYGRTRSKDTDSDAAQRRTPPTTVFRSSVLALALISSIAMFTGGAPAALTVMVRPLAFAALALVGAVGLVGYIWGCRAGLGVRGAYGVAQDDDDVEVELTPFTAEQADEVEADMNGNAAYDDEYLDEEDGYLADEGEIESSRKKIVVSGSDRGSERSMEGERGLPVPRGTSRQGRVGVGQEEAAGMEEGKGAGRVANQGSRLEAPPAQSLFPSGHTMEL